MLRLPTAVCPEEAESGLPRRMVPKKTQQEAGTTGRLPFAAIGLNERLYAVPIRK